MEDLEREQNQGVITSREQLIELIALRKKQFDEVLDQYDSLKSEISKLEEKLSEMGESLKNERCCHNQVMFALKNCKGCAFFFRCVYVGKEDYGRFKL